MEGGTAEDAERLYAELLGDLYAVQFHMQVRGFLRAFMDWQGSQGCM